MSYSEYFLDDEGLSLLSGVVRSVNSPTKYGSNPAFGNASWTWDKEINYCMPQLIGGTLNLWYTGFDSVPTAHTCKATSADGITFTRPTLNLHTYSGSTANNLVLAANTHSGGVHYDAALSPAYYLASESKAGESAYGCYLWTSTDGNNWTAAKTIYQSANNGDYREGRQIVQRADGRWLFYYIHNGTAQRRQVGAFLSATSDVTGSWSDLGVLIDVQTQDSQIYHFHEQALGDDLRLGLACNYNKTTEQMDSLLLYTSRDHVTWRLLTDDWLSIGAGGAWDDEMLIPSLPLIRFDNDWRVYFAGFAEDHATFPRNARIGFASIGYGRIGGVGTTGRVITKPITVGASESLTVNADASGGSLGVTLLDADGHPVADYTSTEGNTVTSDTYSTEITWGGNSIPAGVYKLRFELSAATLYSFEVA